MFLQQLDEQLIHGAQQTTRIVCQTGLHHGMSEQLKRKTQIIS